MAKFTKEISSATAKDEDAQVRIYRGDAASGGALRFEVTFFDDTGGALGVADVALTDAIVNNGNRSAFLSTLLSGIRAAAEESGWVTQ